MRPNGGRKEAGASLVEFALVVPLLALMLFGIVDFGYVMNRDTLVNNAAREGAREGSLNPDSAAIEDVVRSVLSDLDGTITVQARCTKAAGGPCALDNSDTPADEGTVDSGDKVVVTVRYDHQWITFAPSWAGLGRTLELDKTVEMRVE